VSCQQRISPRISTLPQCNKGSLFHGAQVKSVAQIQYFDRSVDGFVHCLCLAPSFFYHKNVLLATSPKTQPKPSCLGIIPVCTDHRRKEFRNFGACFLSSCVNQPKHIVEDKVATSTIWQELEGLCIRHRSRLFVNLH